MSVGAVQTGKFYVVLSGVGPVDAIIDEVQGQPIGPGDLVLHDDTSVGTVHPDSPDVRVVSPVGPVQVPKQKGRVLSHVQFQSSRGSYGMFLLTRSARPRPKRAALSGRC